MVRAEACSVRVDLVYCPRVAAVDVRTLDLPQDATVRDAVAQSGILSAHPQLDLAKLRVGIWGRRCRLDKVLRQGDRIEVYRALTVDPKEARRQRHAGQKAARSP